MTEPRQRVFISSVMDSYKNFRDAASEGIRQAGCEPVRAEDFPAASAAYETVSAFTNTIGGWLVYGVRDQGGAIAAHLTTQMLIKPVKPGRKYVLGEHLEEHFTPTDQASDQPCSGAVDLVTDPS